METCAYPLDPDTLRSHLIGLHSPWRKIDVFDHINSTNTALLQQAEQGHNIDHHVILAEHQSNGRGRCGRTWISPPYTQIALSAGIALDDIPITSWGWIPLLTGVAIVDTLISTLGISHHSIGLKWPNDLLVHDHKLAGILVEVVPTSPIVVIGVGINVSTITDYEPTSIALDALNFSPTQRNELTIELLRHLGQRIQAWKNTDGHDQRLRSEYRQYSCTLGQHVRVTLPGQTHQEGIATDIDEWGRLCLKTESGLLTISAGDVSRLRPTGS